MKKRRAHKTISPSHLLEGERWLVDSSNLGKRGAVRIAAVFPNTYYVGMSNLGFHFILKTCLAHKGYGVERFFYENHSDGRLTGLESDASFQNFQVVLFSISSELDYVKIPQMLQLGGVEPFREKRTLYDPLIVAGGFAVTLNPLPLTEFVDILVMGDGEVSLPRLLNEVANCRGDKNRILDTLQGSPGFFISRSDTEKHDTPASALRIAANYYPFDDDVLSSAVISSDTEFSNTCLIEISRGCPHKCKFCFVGHNKNPWRSHSLDSILNVISSAVPAVSRFGLIASALPPRKIMNPLCEFIREHSLTISISSVRVDDLNVTLLNTLVETGQRSITLAPECAIERRRFEIGKRISDESLFEGINLCLECGIKKIKLYFLIGLPGETDDDIIAIVELMTKIMERFKSGYRFSLVGGIGIFTPRPGIPLSGNTFAGIETTIRKINLLRDNLRTRAERISITVASPYEAAVESLLGNYGEEAREFLRTCLASPKKWRKEIRRYSSLFTAS